MPALSSVLAIGNPIIDITANIEKELIEKYGLRWGETVFSTPENESFFNEIENRPTTTYIPGGSIQNTLRVASLVSK